MNCYCVCSQCGKQSEIEEYGLVPDQSSVNGALREGAYGAQDRLNARLREQGWILEEEDTCPSCVE